MTTNPASESSPTLTIENKIASITINRPSVANRLAPEDVQTIKDHVAEVNTRSEVLVLIIRSPGKYFCAGYDIHAFADPDAPSSLFFGEMVDDLEMARPITIAAVHGGVYGGGTDMCLACDFRIGSEGANMFMPATRLGLHFYPGGLVRYYNRLGLDRAKRMFLLGEKLDAKQMLELGFLTELVSEQELDDQVSTLANTLADMAPLPLLGVKKHLNLIAQGKFDKQAITDNVLLSEDSEDILEGIAAWNEKRPARFMGK